MAEPINVTPNLVPDPSGCMPGNRQELANFIAQAISVQFQGDSFSFFNSGINTPSAENRDRPWWRLDSGGFPLGWYGFYNGAWRRTSELPLYSIIQFIGSGALFDGTGRGISGTQGDGFLLCNGNNGTPNLTDKFIVASTNYGSGSWTSTINPDAPGGYVGGSTTVTLNINNLPPINTEVPIGYDVGGLGRFVFGSNSDTGTYGITAVGEAGGARPVPFKILPPWYSLAFLQWNPLA